MGVGGGSAVSAIAAVWRHQMIIVGLQDGSFNIYDTIINNPTKASAPPATASAVNSILWLNMTRYFVVAKANTITIYSIPATAPTSFPTIMSLPFGSNVLYLTEANNGKNILFSLQSGGFGILKTLGLDCHETCNPTPNRCDDYSEYGCLTCSSGF